MFNSNFPVIDTLNILLHNCDHDPNNLLIALKKGKSLVRSTQFLILSFPKKKISLQHQSSCLVADDQ